jgi:hypothetical protein
MQKIARREKMENYRKIIVELREYRDKIDVAIAALTNLAEGKKLGRPPSRKKQLRDERIWNGRHSRKKRGRPLGSKNKAPGSERGPVALPQTKGVA